ncbi:DivIVA domain-containing protein [Kribbella sp. CA-293567]|nr:DivIVA domain-containing protein [Kribbella sp. CA-293567]
MPSGSADRPGEPRAGRPIESIADPADRPTNPADRPTDSTVDHAVAPRRLRDAPHFAVVKLREGYDMAEVDDFVDRVMATVNGRPVDRPVTAREIRNVRFSPVRIREGYDVMQVDLFLEEAESWLTGR